MHKTSRSPLLTLSAATALLITGCGSGSSSSVATPSSKVTVPSTSATTPFITPSSAPTPSGGNSAEASSTPSASGSSSSPAPTVTVTESASAAPAPTVTVTKSASSEPSASAQESKTESASPSSETCDGADYDYGNISGITCKEAKGIATILTHHKDYTEFSKPYKGMRLSTGWYCTYETSDEALFHCSKNISDDNAGSFDGYTKGTRPSSAE